jgi:hypothetical protein
VKRSSFLISLVLLLMLVSTSSASAATWTEIQEVDVGISNPSWVQIQRVDVVVSPAKWNIIQTVEVEINQAEWVLIQTVEVEINQAEWVLIQTVEVQTVVVIDQEEWVLIQTVEVQTVVVIDQEEWVLIQTVDVEINQAEWVLIQTVEVSVAMPSGPLVWTGLGVDNLASNPENWNQGIAPFNGADVVFDSTSVKSCTWDLPAWKVTVNSLTLAKGYTGTLTQGDVDIGIGAGGYHQYAGVFTPNSAYAVYSAGDFEYDHLYGMITQDLLNLHTTGEGYIRTRSAYLLSWYNTGNYMTSGPVWLNHQRPHIFKNDGTITISSDDASISIYKYSYHHREFINNGLIQGDGKLEFVLRSEDYRDVKLGNILCPVELKLQQFSTRSVDISLGGDAELSRITVYASHEMHTITLDTNGYSLTASSVTVGTRGNILWGEGIHRIGSLDTSVGSSDFEKSHIIMTGGGTIKLGYGQQVNDLTLVSGMRTTLLSDLNVKGNIIGIKDLVMNNYRLILSGSSKVGPYPSNFNVSEPVFIPITSPIMDGLQVYGDIPRWLRYDPIKGGLYGIPTKLGMNEFNITVYSPYVSLLTQRISFAVVDVPIIEHASKGQSVGNIISIVLTMVIVGICGITRRSSGGFDYDVSNALLGAAVGISVLVFTSVIPSYGLVLVALIFVAMYWGGR